jgi:hypothetical protein
VSLQVGNISRFLTSGQYLKNIPKPTPLLFNPNRLSQLQETEEKPYDFEEWVKDLVGCIENVFQVSCLVEDLEARASMSLIR